MDTKRLERVWQQVRGESAAPVCTKEDREEQTLAAFLADEDRDRALYGALAARCAGPAGRTLARLRDDEARHWRALQREFFLLTGNSAPAGRRKAERTAGVLSALRRAALRERQGADAYLRAAGETASPRLGALYRRLAGDEARHARELLALLEKAME